MTGFGASRPLPRVSAKVSSSRPRADVRPSVGTPLNVFTDLKSRARVLLLSDLFRQALRALDERVSSGAAIGPLIGHMLYRRAPPPAHVPAPTAWQSLPTAPGRPAKCVADAGAGTASLNACRVTTRSRCRMRETRSSGSVRGRPATGVPAAHADPPLTHRSVGGQVPRRLSPSATTAQRSKIDLRHRPHSASDGGEREQEFARHERLG